MTETKTKPRKPRGPARKLTIQLSETHSAAVVRLCEYDAKILGVPVNPETMILNLILYRCMKIAADTLASSNPEMVGLLQRWAVEGGYSDAGVVLTAATKKLLKEME